jgi:hypothetical protein
MAGKCCSQLVDYISPKSWTAGIRNYEKKRFESFLSNFLNIAPTLGRAKSSIPHGARRFNFFPIFLLKLEYTKTFISIVGILV